MVRCMSCCYFLRHLGEKEWRAGVIRKRHTIQCQRFPKSIDMNEDNLNYQDCPAYQNATKDIELRTW